MISSVQHQQIQGINTTNSAAIENIGGKNLPLSGSQADAIPSSSAVTNFEAAESLSGIVRKYDILNMSPQEMSDMSQELYQKGTISFQDHALLSFQSELGSDSTGDISQANPHPSKDFISHGEEQLKFQEQQGGGSFSKNDRGILNILGDLDAIAHSDSAQYALMG